MRNLLSTGLPVLFVVTSLLSGGCASDGESRKQLETGYSALEAKNYDAALVDLNTLLTKYPTAKEREAALQQKALILGQKDDPKGMADAFRQLLKEYPKSSVAAQASRSTTRDSTATRDCAR